MPNHRQAGFLMSAAHLVLGALGLLSFSAHGRALRAQFWLDLHRAVFPILAWFVVLSCFMSLVIVRLVMVTAESYDLTQYSVQVLVRALVIELVPLFAALWVAIRYTLASSYSADVSLHGLSVRAAAGSFAIVFFALLNCVLALAITYLMLHGPSMWAIAGYTHQVGRIFLPQVLVVLVAKTALFCMAVTIIPAADALSGRASGSQSFRLLTRIFLVLILIEIIGLVAIYF